MPPIPRAVTAAPILTSKQLDRITHIPITHVAIRPIFIKMLADGRGPRVDVNNFLRQIVTIWATTAVITQIRTIVIAVLSQLICKMLSSQSLNASVIVSKFIFPHLFFACPWSAFCLIQIGPSQSTTQYKYKAI